ncbi:MAG: 2-oxoglutarate dehydrogenase, E2 component, dihydrolipoamide succinyltransferase [Ignavibacteria bacterium RIFOXYB2_FULL_35_12]|nr:MAG: 2-oxoglutarate dehydrogenase, E2 component, dihydrolipoamide succinyltransferase [Ignavibacteria bacterium GWA2_36_19]OGU57895.1 MAG: 2-oxoglutarate dehydrogenase, E2 component, dihydrolipoamide succinyltransferase [Ignavibacteria bacterium GWF2_35_20]OGU83135.1 MAG: 2-oxoglutarate dehydrogenase, E2 component, dihydrolipoamide succinyltransferase [Ignavibacteria bacterium RIFOXYA2_FULL_35_9]OGU87216.1 MAG: 2-oxoglutarate dehydrogenase, E2 component, dihydrolipoamide succinyltransferase [
MNIIMPKMGESVNEGTIIKWHKKKGDTVKRDEIIFEISTDKVDTEIPSPAAGILSEIIVKEGETVEVGTTVAVVQTDGEPFAEEIVDETVSEPVPTEPQESMHDAIGKNIDQVTTEAGEGIIEITMPKMGESVMEGTIIKWYKKIGDPVKKDETIFEISTDKVDTEIPSPEEGILTEILVSEQQTVEVGTVVARLSSKTASILSHKEQKPTLPDKSAEQKVDKEKIEVPAALEVRDKQVNKSSARFYSPLVLSIAQKENVSFDELEKINGTGVAARITKNDILNYIEQKKSGKLTQVKEEKKEVYKAPSEPYRYEAVASSDGVQKIEMDNIRLKIMQHMVKSRDTSVHVTAMIEVDMNKVYNFIQAKKEEFLRNEGVKLTYMPFITHAAVKALKEYPLVNSTIDGTTIYQKKYINLGIAVAIEPTGLIVPNIKDAGDKNIIGLAKSINDLATRARVKKLTPDDISNGTFSITNYGVFGTIFGTPIINQPEVAILGVGAVQKKPVVMEIDGTETIAIKPIMSLTLSHDHRLVDGMLGGKFIKFIKDTLENFDGRVF